MTNLVAISFFAYQRRRIITAYERPYMEKQFLKINVVTFSQRLFQIIKQITLILHAK